MFLFFALICVILRFTVVDYFLGICRYRWLQRTCWLGSEVFKGSSNCYSRCDYSCQAVHCARSPWLLGQQDRQTPHCSL